MRMSPAESFVSEQQLMNIPDLELLINGIADRVDFYLSGTDPQVDLTNSSLRGLSYALRHRETWPAGFKWYYGDHGTCAIAMTCALWPRIGLHDPHNMTRAFGISREQAFFFFSHDYGKTNKRDVTPVMVANRIDAYLARQCP